VSLSGVDYFCVILGVVLGVGLTLTVKWVTRKWGRVVLFALLVAAVAFVVALIPWKTTINWLYPIVYGATQSLWYPYMPLVLGTVIGAGLAFLSQWHFRKCEREEERRKRIYAPLFDELPKIKNLVETCRSISFAAPGHGDVKEYDRIKARHILYMVPKTLQTNIKQLYEDLLKQFDRQLNLAKDKLQESMFKDLVAGGPAGAGTDSRAKDLAMMGRFVLSKDLPEDWKAKMELAFATLKTSNWKSLQNYASLDKMFEDLIGRSDTNPIQEVARLRTLQKDCLELLGNIYNRISKDLGVE